MVTSNRVTRSEGLKLGPLLHPAHLSGIDCRFSFMRPLCTANKMANEKKRLGGKLNYLSLFPREAAFRFVLYQLIDTPVIGST